MKKRFMIYIIILFTILFLLTGCDFVNKNSIDDSNKVNGNNSDINSNEINSNNSDSNSNEINGDNLDINSNDAKNNNLSNSSNENNSNNELNTSINSNDTNAELPKETDLATFSTPIIDKRENRQNNLRITCSKLNGVTVNSNSTFSFCNTIGKSTAEEGYKEADVLINGEHTPALGGGNCQISTTLYNAVLQCSRINSYRTT